MICRKFYIPFTTFIIILAPILEARIHKSRRNSPEIRPVWSGSSCGGQDDNLYPGDVLPSDKQITAFLFQGEKKSFTYICHTTNSSLSITVNGCTSSIVWSVTFYPIDSSQPVTSKNIHSEMITLNPQTFHLNSLRGKYTIELMANDKNTYIHIYVSTELGGPQAIKNSPSQNVLKILKRQHKRITIHWEQSPVDPQATDYCLVINSHKRYASYCSAHGDKFGVTFPDGQIKKTWTSSVSLQTVAQKVEAQNEPLIFCVESKTHYNFGGVDSSKRYFVDLFAFNKQTNLTYLYGTGYLTFDKRIKPIRLRDNKSSYVNMKKMDGKVVFRHKIGKLLSDTLKIHVMPCGGSVDVHVISRGKIVAFRKWIDSFGILLVSNVKIGSVYYIKVLSSNNEELRRITGVEVLTTTRPISGTLIPNMPLEHTVQEYVSLRKCDSVTVGWLTSPEQRVARYCLIVREGQLKESEMYRIPNQCGLENRLKKSIDFKTKYCRDINNNTEQVIIQKIDQLKTNKSYVIQVTLKNPKGKTLSYDLLQIHTKPFCDTSNSSSSLNLLSTLQ